MRGLWAKWWLCKHKNLSSNSQNPHKVGLDSMCLWSQCSYREMGSRDKRILRGLRTGSLVLAVSNKTLPQTKWKMRTQNPRLSSELHMYTMAYVCSSHRHTDHTNANTYLTYRERRERRGKERDWFLTVDWTKESPAWNPKVKPWTGLSFILWQCCDIVT